MKAALPSLGRNGRGGPQVHQFLSSLGFRDACGTHTIETRRALSAAGLGGAIWSEHIQPQMGKEARASDIYPSLRAGRRRNNVLLYQAATGSRGLVSQLVNLPEPKTIYYHNITPARFFQAWAPDDALILAWGREELKILAPHVRVAVANSQFSAADLRYVGIEDVRIVPPYLPPGLGTPPDPAQTEWLRRTKLGLDVLCVSRLMPHKGHLHVLRALAAIRAAIDPGARLLVVGAWGPEPYMRAVFRLREKLGLEGVVFMGSVSDATLAAHYQEAEVFLHLSEHEGFGLPLVEAMRQGLPVVAYDTGAVAETLDGAGVLLGTLDPLVVAEVVARVGRDEDLRAQIVRRQSERVRRLEALPRDRLLVDAVLAAASPAELPAADREQSVPSDVVLP